MNNTENSSANAPQASEVAKEGAEARVAATRIGDNTVSLKGGSDGAWVVSLHGVGKFWLRADHGHGELGWFVQDIAKAVEFAMREASTDGKRTDATEGESPTHNPEEPTALSLLEELVGAAEELVVAVDEFGTEAARVGLPMEMINPLARMIGKKAILAAATKHTKSFLSERGKGA